LFFAIGFLGAQHCSLQVGAQHNSLQVDSWEHSTKEVKESKSGVIEKGCFGITCSWRII
jgi:hypothetical protein